MSQTAVAAEPTATASDAIARHASELRFEQLDALTVEAARWRLLDVIGCAFGGTRASGSHALVDVVRQESGRGDSTLAGQRGAKVPAGAAALVNAILARSFDYEVMGVLIEGRLIPSHHAATTAMTALALCEARGLGGRELLTAMVIGDDIAARTLAASGLDFAQGWDGAATYTALGAAATAGRLLGLSPLQMRNALGIVVEQIGGTIQALWDGGTSFKLGQGTAGRNAVLAAQLAAGGWTAMRDPLLGRFAFFAQYTAGCIDPAILTRDLGRRFWAEAYFKPYPACMATHVCIEASMEAGAGLVFEPEAIESVTVRLPAASLANFCGKDFIPGDYPHADAIFSYRHMVAGVLLSGSIAQEHYEEERLRDPRLSAVAAKIRLEPLASAATGAEVKVDLRDGRRLSGRASAPSRSPLMTMASAAEIEQKFMRQMAFSGVASDRLAAELRDLVLTLDTQGSVNRLCTLLAGDRAGHAP